MIQRKAALLEIDGTHEECLYSQLMFLETGGYQTVVINEESLRAKTADFNIRDREVFFKLKDLKPLPYLRMLWKIRNYIVDNGIHTVIFNSSHGHLIRDFTMLPFPKATRFYGTLHGINKLKGSFTQKLISRRIRNYFLLSDYLIDNLKFVPHQGLRFESYYPIFFPEFKNAALVTRPANELWIGIPGQVEYKRRDYETLVRSFAELADKPDYRFLLLGSYTHRDGNGAQLKQLIDELDVKKYFVFTGYLQYPEYHAWLKQCDVIMPLVHPGNDGFEKYLIYQITGSYNLAFAYKKPLLMLSEFSRYEDFKENAVFYTLETLGKILEGLPERLVDLKPRIYRQSKWSYSYQEEKYLAFIR